MPWDEIARRLSELGVEMLESIFDLVIQNAEQDPANEFIISEELEQQIVDAAEDAELELNAEAVSDFQENAADDFEFDSTSAIIVFFFKKQIADGIRRIHAATIARQILEDDREEQQQAALDRSLRMITTAAEAEASSAFALKHQQLAIESDFVYYRYHTSEDDVVRPEHNARNQRIFRYGAERIVDDIPGLAINCRCFAEPIDIEEALQSTFFYPEDRPENQAMAQSDMKRKFDIRCENGTVTIDVIGVIDFWEGNDFDAFSQKVNGFIDSKDQELIINITSYGGDADESFKAYDLLSELENKITVNVYGYAASAATHFVMAADFATIGENDNFMIHQAWTCPCGNKEQLQETVATLEEYDDKQIAIYMSKTGRSREEVENLLNEERIISAEEALDFGFVDEIRPDSNRSRAARGEPTAQANISALKIEARKPTSISGSKPMKLEDIFAFLKDASDDDKAQILTKLGGVSKEDSDEAVSEVQAKLDKANTQITVNESVISAAQAKLDDSDSEDSREKIRAELLEEIESENEKKAKVIAQVEKVGLKVEGKNTTEILANAIEQAGGNAKDENDKFLADAVLEQIWTSTCQILGANHNAEEVGALGAQTTVVATKSPLQGSRASRIKANRGG